MSAMKEKQGKVSQNSKPTMCPEERGIMPFAALPYAIPNLETYYVVADVAEIISGRTAPECDLEWEASYHVGRDALLIRGTIAAKIVNAIPQPLTILQEGHPPTRLETIPVAIQPWVNFPDSRGELAAWFLVPPGLRRVIGAVAERLRLDWPSLPSADLPSVGKDIDERTDSSSAPLLDWIQRNPVGSFCYAGGLLHLASHIVAVRRRWPKPYRIVVVTASNRTAKNVAKAIERLRVEYSPLDVGSILVVGVHRLHRFLNVDSSGDLNYQRSRVILLVAEAGMVAAETAAFALGRLPHVRLYGFLAASDRLEPFVAARVAAFFGVDRVRLFDTQDGSSPVEVQVRKWGVDRALPQGSVPSKTLKEQGVWFCAARNRYIHFLARDAAGPAISPMFRRFRRKLGRRPVVVVLVESTSHQQKLLESWDETWSAIDVDINGNPLWRAGKPGCRKIIATFAGAKHLSAVDIIIRCDGGPGIPAVVLKAVSLSSKALLVDIKDTYPPALRRFGRSRREAYGTQGWIEARDTAAEFVEHLASVITGDS